MNVVVSVVDDVTGSDGDAVTGMLDSVALRHAHTERPAAATSDVGGGGIKSTLPPACSGDVFRWFP
jgi:beta-lactam-binding protein with PASTA domain